MNTSPWIFAYVSAFAACSGSSGGGPSPAEPANTNGDAGGDAGSPSSRSPEAGSTDASPTALGSAAGIDAYIAGKTWVTTGSDIAPDPLGYSPDLDLGGDTQCWNRVTFTSPSPGIWNIVWIHGTFTGATAVGQTGHCDPTTPAATTTGTAAVTISNVQGNAACFDIAATAALGSGGTVASAGRGSISEDGKTLSLEAFIPGQATGATCSDGPVGSHTITLNGAPFSGGAVDVYRLQ